MIGFLLKKNVYLCLGITREFSCILYGATIRECWLQQDIHKHLWWRFNKNK